MKTFRWLVVVTVVTGVIVGAVDLYVFPFVNPFGIASSAGASGPIPASQLPGQSLLLAIESTTLLLALLLALPLAVLYGVAGRSGWRMALWGAAIASLLPSAITTFSHIPFFFVPTLLPAALMFLAALFSLGAAVPTDDTNRDADVERQPLIQSSFTPAPRPTARLVLGAVVALLGGAAYIFLLPVFWVAFLAALAASSIGATLLIRSPVAALVVPVGVWLGATAADIVYGAANARLADSILWGGMLEFAAILIVIAVIPALVGVAIGAALPLDPWRERINSSASSV
jgi:hypothetical protein